MNDLPTPISVIENYFGQKLTPRTVASFAKVTEDQWVDFAKTYYDQMKSGFTPEAIARHTKGAKVRLHFDRTLHEDYSRALAGRYVRTPLLGFSQYPEDGVDYTASGLNHAIAPLRKHLLVADAVYLTDNFYRCFDAVADSFDRYSWRGNPNIAYQVRHSISAILAWLPILAGIRNLVRTGAIVFLPYFAIPTFPFLSTSPLMARQAERLHIPNDPSLVPAGIANFDLPFLEDPANYAATWDDVLASREPRLDTQSALCAWINADLLGLSPVYADKRTFEWASKIHFREETQSMAVSDLLAMDIIPLAEDKPLSVADIASMRKNEAEFLHLRKALVGCQKFVLAQNLAAASKETISRECKHYLNDIMTSNKLMSPFRFLDNNYAAGTVASIAIGAAFLTANPWVGLAVPAVLTPKTALIIEKKLNPRIRAAAKLQALL